MKQIIEDLICYPAMYVLHSRMGLHVFFSAEYWNMQPFNLYPTLFMSTILLCLFLIWTKRILQSEGRAAIATILIAPFLYWLTAGIIALPIELLWHGLIERRFLATFDYTIAFHPFCSPILMDFELVGEKWIEQGPGYYCNPPYEAFAKPFSRELHFGLIIALWATLAVSVNMVALILTKRWSTIIGASLTDRCTTISHRANAVRKV
jgi:hypothetical protein